MIILFDNLYIRSMKLEYNKIPKQDYIVNLNVVKNIRTLDFKKLVTFFVGKNGLGKSTLIEAIATKKSVVIVSKVLVFIAYYVIITLANQKSG